MSRLILVRHAQASFFAEDYDQLSDLGDRQSEHLAAEWIRQERTFDAIIAGPRVRHRRTAQIVIDAYRSQGRPCPELVTAAEWDEHQVDRAITQTQDALLQRHPQLVEPLHLLHTATDRVAKARQFQRVFEAVSQLWVKDELPGVEIEPWSVFRDRVLHGMKEIVAHHARGRTVACLHVRRSDHRGAPTDAEVPRRGGPGDRLAAAKYVRHGVPLVGRTHHARSFQFPRPPARPTGLDVSVRN